MTAWVWFSPLKIESRSCAIVTCPAELLSPLLFMQICRVSAHIWPASVSLTGRLDASNVLLHWTQRLPAAPASDKGASGLVGVYRHQPCGRSEGSDAGVRSGWVCECWCNPIPSALVFSQTSTNGSHVASITGTSPHAATSLSVTPGVRQANVSWEAGFDGGSAQTYSVW